jgi:thiamine-phosphate pyrophosphorylase
LGHMNRDRQRARHWEVACALNGRAGLLKPFPPLFFVTDPRRTPDPAATAGRLPRGAGVIFRGFGAADAPEVGRALRAACDRAGLLLLVGQDADLALACGADGVHLPERALADAPSLRRRRPGWRLTGAAHGAQALARAAEYGLDAALLSPVFESASPSAGLALGVAGFAALVAGAALPVYALGGVTAETASALLGSGAAGIAAVDGIVELFG